MILQNLSKAIREQNYFAVALEFVIVIAGVVIGFQINAWNETRGHREREASALALIQDDIAQNIVELEARSRFDTDRTRQHTVMVNAVSAGVLAPEDRAAFEDAVTRLLFFSRPPVSQPSYEALQQSGDLALIRDAGLMSRLNELRSDLAWIESQHSSFRAGLSEFAPIWRPYVFHQPTDDPRRTSARVDLEGLSADPQAVSALVEASRMHAIFAAYLERYAGALSAMCAELAAMTDQPCEPNTQGEAP
jgi:hypothetical protein